jgi:hypothetical protein
LGGGIWAVGEGGQHWSMDGQRRRFRGCRNDRGDRTISIWRDKLSGIHTHFYLPIFFRFSFFSRKIREIKPPHLKALLVTKYKTMWEFDLNSQTRIICTNESNIPQEHHSTLITSSISAHLQFINNHKCSHELVTEQDI